MGNIQQGKIANLTGTLFTPFISITVILIVFSCNSSNNANISDAGKDSGENDEDGLCCVDGESTEVFDGSDGSDESCPWSGADLWVDVILSENIATLAVRKAFTDCTDQAGRPYSQDSGLPVGPRTPEDFCIDVDYCCYLGGFCPNLCTEGAWFNFDDGREPIYLGANDYSDFSASGTRGVTQIRLIGCCEEVDIPVSYGRHGIQFTDLVRTQDRLDLSFTTEVPTTSASTSLGWSDPGDPHATYCAMGESQVGSLHDDYFTPAFPRGIGLGIQTYRREQVYPTGFGEITIWSKDTKSVSESSVFTMIDYSPSENRWKLFVYGVFDETLVWGESERGVFKATETVEGSILEHDLLLEHFSIDDSGSNYDLSVVIRSLLIQNAAMEYHAGETLDTLLWETREGSFRAEFPHIAPVNGLELQSLHPDVYELVIGPVEVISTDGTLPPRTVEIHLLVDFGIVPRPVLE